MSLHKRTLLYIALLLFISIFLTSCGQAAEINVACDVGDLIDAINSANANSDPTKLILDPNCTYPFTSKDNSDGGQGPNSLPIITTKIIIEGNNATLLRDTGIGFRFFFITSSGSLRLEDITLEKGYAIITTGEQTNSRGGAIFNDGGAFRAVRSVFLDNSAWHGEGGAIYNLGILTLDDTTFEINFSNYGGAIFNGSMLDIPVVLQDVIFDRNFAIESGGAIYNGSAETDFFINRSQFKSNSSYEFHGGAIYMETGELEIRNSEFHTNRSGSTIHPTGDGGAIYSPSGDVTLIKTNFIADRAYGVGGTLYGGPGSTVKLREVVSEASDACHGGGSLYVEGETEILQSTFKNNRSGGVYFTWGLDTNNTSECLVGDGGAIYNTGTLTLDQSLVDGFSAETDGDGVYNLGDLVIINSTFNIYTNSTAEAINNLGSAEISFSTIVHSNLVNSGIMTVKDLIVANYTANCANSGSFTPMGENIALDASCPFSIILQSFSDLGISSSLSDNGGPTLTHLVEDTSPAIDMSDCLSASGIPIFKDQRDIYRPHPFLALTAVISAPLSYITPHRHLLRPFPQHRYLIPFQNLPKTVIHLRIKKSP